MKHPQRNSSKTLRDTPPLIGHHTTFKYQARIVVTSGRNAYHTDADWLPGALVSDTVGRGKALVFYALA